MYVCRNVCCKSQVIVLIYCILLEMVNKNEEKKRKKKLAEKFHKYTHSTQDTHIYVKQRRQTTATTFVCDTKYHENNARNVHKIGKNRLKCMELVRLFTFWVMVNLVWLINFLLKNTNTHTYTRTQDRANEWMNDWVRMSERKIAREWSDLNKEWSWYTKIQNILRYTQM